MKIVLFISVIVGFLGVFSIGLSASEFRNGGSYPIPQNGVVAVADFTGDGIVDVAVGGAGFLDILPGNGDGTLGSKITTQINTPNPSTLALADLNADGKMDIVVTGNLTNPVVLLGNGDGTFRVSELAMGPAPSGVAVADFNGDGKLDLAVSNSQGGGPLKGSVVVALGNGDGTFQAPVFYAAGVRPNSVAVGDFNGDHVQDLLAGTSTSAIAVLLGNGDGTFQRMIGTQIGPAPSFVKAVDLDNDGKTDVVATLISRTGQNDQVVLALGNGDGTFGLATVAAKGSQLNATAVADVNKDGFLDLIVTNRTPNSGSLEVVLGNGNGTFQPPQRYSVGPNGAFSAATGDLNGDGYLDVVFATSNKVGVLLNNGAQP